MKVELIYDRDCPNAQAARDIIHRMIERTPKRPDFIEHCRQSESAPAYARSYGSPTILVDGVDVYDPDTACTGDSCRLYRDEQGQVSGLPPASALEAALAVTRRSQPGAFTRGVPIIASLGTAGLAALPILTCPACWPAYVGLLGVLGLGFLNYTPYIGPGLLLLAPLSLISVWWQSRRKRNRGHRSYLPVVVAALGVIVLFAARWVVHKTSGEYVGLALLLSASLWSVHRSRHPQHACDC